MTIRLRETANVEGNFPCENVSCPTRYPLLKIPFCNYPSRFQCITSYKIYKRTLITERQFTSSYSSDLSFLHIKHRKWQPTKNLQCSRGTEYLSVFLWIRLQWPVGSKKVHRNLYFTEGKYGSLNCKKYTMGN